MTPNTIVALLAAVILTGCAGNYFRFDQVRQVRTGMTAQELQPFRRQDKWDSKPTEELARDLANALLVHPVKLVRTQDMANYISVLTVVASDDEPIDNILALREPFATIFNAIGKIKGRVLQPDVIAERDQKAQPASGFAPIKIG